MINSLSQPNTKESVQLLRSQFAGFLGEVGIVYTHEGFAESMVSEGVLLKPGKADRYRMASPLIDGLIRTRVIPTQFSDAPVTIPLVQDNSSALRFEHTDRITEILRQRTHFQGMLLVVQGVDRAS
jgi:hypothetical protein